MGPFAFLSEEWVSAARQLRHEYAGKVPTATTGIRINLIVTGVPFGPGTENAHLDTSTGELMLDSGHLAEPDVTLTLDYETAKAIIVEQNPQVAMQAFVSGRIKVEGDMAKLFAMQATPTDPVHLEIAERLRSLTA
jgi:hypothetical protein